VVAWIAGGTGAGPATEAVRSIPVLVATAAMKRCTAGSWLLTLPLMISDADTLDFL